ncbi:uncharacterized protein LOC135226337 [Macrobrachium nipponense]|uniref:uncharacterized protein LOC135226337 n=1 Tax=Macrobrachium nipponense TaxID=159736 RepID=UPI0030C8C263
MQSFMKSNKILSRVMEHIRVSCSSDQGPPEPKSPTPSGSDQQPKPGEIEAVTLMTDETPVIVASMRGGHRCLAADRSECAFVKYLPGQEAYPLPVSESKISESTENGKVSSGRTRTYCHRTFSTTSNINRHLRLGHGVTPNTEQQGKYRHKKIANKRILCLRCGKDYKLWKYYSCHLKLGRCNKKNDQ